MADERVDSPLAMLGVSVGARILGFGLALLEDGGLAKLKEATYAIDRGLAITERAILREREKHGAAAARPIDLSDAMRTLRERHAERAAAAQAPLADECPREPRPPVPEEREEAPREREDEPAREDDGANEVNKSIYLTPPEMPGAEFFRTIHRRVHPEVSSTNPLDGPTLSALRAMRQAGQLPERWRERLARLEEEERNGRHGTI